MLYSGHVQGIYVHSKASLALSLASIATTTTRCRAPASCVAITTDLDSLVSDTGCRQCRRNQRINCVFLLYIVLARYGALTGCTVTRGNCSCSTGSSRRGDNARTASDVMPPSVDALTQRRLLWPPYVIGQAIILLPCGFFLLSSIFWLSSFFSSPNLSGRRLDVYHTLTHGVTLVRI